MAGPATTVTLLMAEHTMLTDFGILGKTSPLGFPWCFSGLWKLGDDFGWSNFIDEGFFCDCRGVVATFLGFSAILVAGKVFLEASQFSKPGMLHYSTPVFLCGA